MRQCIAINNSPYYYYNPFMARSIGLGAPRTMSVVRRLAHTITQCAMDCDDQFVPGIQFGVESDRALQSPSIQRSLLALAEKEGISYIVHIPDLVVPGRYYPSGIMSRMASYGYARADPTVPWFERFMKGRIASAAAIGASQMVLHLPNGGADGSDTVLSFLTPSLSEMLLESGITICIENCNNSDSPFFADVSAILSLLERLDDNYAFCFDYGHYMVGRSDPSKEDLLTAARTALMHHVHINDTSSDAHLFLGDRPSWADQEMLVHIERQYEEFVLRPSVGIASTYVLERNKPFVYEQLLGSIRRLLNIISVRQ